MTAKRGGSGRPFSGTDFVLDNPAGKWTIDSPPFETEHDVDIYLNQYKLICLECGEKHGNLGVHVSHAHNYMNARDYKKKYNIPYSRALMGLVTLQKCQEAARKRMQGKEYRDQLALYALKAHEKTRELKGSKHKGKPDEYWIKRRIANVVKAKLDVSRPKYLEAINLTISNGITLTKACKNIEVITQAGLSTYVITHPEDKEIVDLYELALKNRKYGGFTQEQSQKGRDAAREKNRNKMHCPKGHPYSGDNLYIASSGSRSCKKCTREAKCKHRKHRQLNQI